MAAKIYICNGYGRNCWIGARDWTRGTQTTVKHFVSAVQIVAWHETKISQVIAGCGLAG